MKKLVGGMSKDSERVDQPDGTYRDALNANLYYSKGAIVNEQGTTVVGSHPMHVIGTISLLNEEIVSFCYVDDSGAETFDSSPDNSAIVLTNVRTKTSRILYKSPYLNFQKTNPIVGEFRVDAKNEIIIYFTDNYYVEEDTPEGKAILEFNPPRAFNITRQLEHLNSSTDPEPYLKLYDEDENYDIEKLSLFARVGKHSVIERADIFEGGVLVSGAYHLALCYSDENFLETDYFVVSNPVYIYQAKEQQYPADVIKGCQAGSQTNKAIKFRVTTFFNNNYKFLQPTIIQRVGNDEFVYKLDRIELANYAAGLDVDVVFTGNEEKSTSSIEDIIIDNVGYLTAKSITQLDDRLYLANLRSRKDIGFQRYANNITIKAVRRGLNRFDVRLFDVISLNKGYAQMLLPYTSDLETSGSMQAPGQTFLAAESNQDANAYTNMNLSDSLIRKTYFDHLYGLLNYAQNDVAGLQDNNDSSAYYSLTGKIAKGYKDYRFSFKQKTFRRGEVYAFYISFVLNDGTETYAYHIPGRDALFAQYTVGAQGGGYDYMSERESFGSGEGKWEAIRDAFGFYPSEIAEHDPDARIYQYVDSSMRDAMGPYDNVTYVGDPLHNNFGFWENINEFYPSTPDFYGGAVLADGTGTINTDLDIRGERVRHHKMPSNLNPRYSFLRMFSPLLSNSEQPKDEFEVTLGQLNSWGYYNSHQSVIDTSNINTVNQTGFDRPYKTSKIISRDPIRLLGIKIENLKIPKHILKKVQGYKIYYAKRKDEDKIVAGQSLAVPAHPRYASVATQNKLLARRGPYKNAFYLYGGIEHNDANAMVISADWKKSTVSPPTGEDSRYVGHPVFTFHDFNMLRKRPTLENITHVTCQAGISFRHFTGGPNVFTKPVTRAELDDGTGASKSGQGGATDLTVFPSLGWIHPDLGNTTDYDIDGQIVDVTDNFIDLQEDVQNPYGVDADEDTPGGKPKKKGFFKRVFGKFKRHDDDDEAIDAEEVKVKDLQIRQWRTAIMIAAKYSMPNHVLDVSEAVKGGSNLLNPDKHWNSSNIPLNQMLFRVDPTSKIYARGQANITVSESTSFKGAQVLYNRGGESSIVIGLDSGLPHLKGYRCRTSSCESYWNPGGGITNSNGSALDILKWGDHQNFLYPDAYYHEPTPFYLIYGDQYGGGDIESSKYHFRGYQYGLQAPGAPYDGYPMGWLVNLESAKTDVYNPFDKQELVWTGYYKAINLDENSLETGNCVDDYGNESNYYTGAESANIYGGDTYITRYAFRTTSQSYGHCYFRAALGYGDPGATVDEGQGPAQNNNFHTRSGGDFQLNRNTTYRFQADLPDFLNARTNDTFGTINGMHIWMTGTNLFDTFEERYAGADSLINNPNNWVQGNNNPQATLFSFMVESDDNIGLRHNKDSDKGVSTKYFDGDVAADVLLAPPTEDFTKQDNLLYEDHYSALQDIRVTMPYPKRRPANEDITTFTTRVIRSKAAGAVIGDQFRHFLANDYKDLPKNRGDIWNMFTSGGMLMIHTEKSLYRTQGKENLAVGDVTAFIGSGDIFAQDPMELRDSKNGYGGTTSTYGGVSTPYGRFYVSPKERKIYSVMDGIEELVSGMESWLRDNMPFRVEQIGLDVYADNFPYSPDAPTGSVPMGFAAAYDPAYKRVLFTKREPVPKNVILEGLTKEYNTPGHVFIQDNSVYIQQLRAGGIINVLVNLANPDYFKPGGWTLSYYPELKIWGSRHSYLPKLYASTSEGLYSYKNTNLWAHDDIDNPGRFYGEVSPFEIEFIDNSAPSGGNTYSSITYWADVKKRNSTDVTQVESRTNPGFTSFYVYNSTQISAIDTNLNYLSNVRKVDTFWYINSFRDLAKYTLQTNDYINPTVPNVVGQFNSTITAPISSEPMFLEEGVVNPEYIDGTKPWHMQKRFVDNFIGVRLSNDNSSTNLLYLYAVGSKFRKSHR